MTQEECVKGLKYLSIAYGSDGFSQDECIVYYEFLAEFSYETFRTAVKNLIRKSKFIPKINELVGECTRVKTQVKNDVLDYMKAQGYFKIPQEYDKAVMWLQTGNVPSWFKEDMNEAYKSMVAYRLEHNETKLLG
jgi:hypothetical protein